MRCGSKKNEQDCLASCRILDLSACRGISASSLQSALPQLQQLEVLHLDGNPEVHPCPAGLRVLLCETILKINFRLEEGWVLCAFQGAHRADQCTHYTGVGHMTSV